MKTKKHKLILSALLTVAIIAIIFLSVITYLSLNNINKIYTEAEKLYSQDVTALKSAGFDTSVSDKAIKNAETMISSIRETKSTSELHIKILCFSAVSLILVGSGFVLFRALGSNSVFGHSSAANTSFEKLDSTLENVESESDRIRKSLTNLSKNMGKHTSTIQNVLDDVEICAYQTQLDGQNAMTVGNVSKSSKEDIDLCNQEMRQMLTAMKGIRESSDNISEIIKIIDDIARQTNLLSLNATVEAARGGEQGKGFGVVAQEVRNLAVRSQKAAQDTSALIEESINRVSAGTDIANKTAKSLSKIVESINKIYQLMTEINNSTDIQAQAFARVSTGLKEISSSVADSLDECGQSTSVSEEIIRHCKVIKDIIESGT